MPGQFFNFSRYFKKSPSSSSSAQDQEDTTLPPNQEVSQTSSVTTTTTQASQNKAVPYSGIGKPPGGGASYSGIGNPPAPTQAGQPQQKADTSKSAIDMNKRVGMDVLSRLTQRTNQALILSVAKAKELKLQYVDTEHVLWALLHDSTIYQLISECKVVPSELQAALEKGFKTGNYTLQPHFSPRVKRVLELSLSAAKSLGYEFISPEHVLLALSQEGEGVAARTLAQLNLKTEALNQKITGKKEIVEKETKGRGSALEQYAEDLTEKAKRGELDPVVGRSWEIERIIHILSRRTKNNPVLIGDAGVGKTAIVEGLALRIAHGDVPETLLQKRILSLDLMSLIAGARHRGEFEERLKNLIKEVKSAAGAIILFIDEIHNMVGAGSGGEGTMDASNILKPSLARGELQTIGTTTVTEYRKYIEKDPALERRFQPVLVAEPTAEVATEMLIALRDKYEAFHRVKISDEAIDAAVKLSQRYIGDRFLPDKAVDLIDEASAAVRLPAISLPEEIKSGEQRLKKLTSEKQEAEKGGDKVHAENVAKEEQDLEKSLSELKEQYQSKKSTTTNIVGPDIIAEIVSRWTNIPINRLTESESAKLLDLENTIHKRLINQDEAVAAVSEAVRRGRAGLKSNKRPIGSFIFMGPTGVGKTELAKAIAEILFGSEEMIVRLDMSEYMEKHEVAKLIGAPPGYVGYEEGGQLTEAVRRHPYSVVLLDEIEKAHPDVFNILIQLLDDGRLTDNKGHTISFKNTIVICTSNLGSVIIQEEMLKNVGVYEKKPASLKQQVFKTYSVSPTGREMITLDGTFWQKETNGLAWKAGALADYFAGSKITSGEAQFPDDGITTHLIAADGSETISSGDKIWFRTSTTSREWTVRSLLDGFKGHVVFNAEVDKPEQQLPTAKLDTHALSPTNTEIITQGDRFWKRENLQIQDWTTGLLSEYFPPDQDTLDKDKLQAAKFPPQRDPASGGTEDKKSDVKNKTVKSDKMKFPSKKWDIHLFKPNGEELVLLGNKFWRRKNNGQNKWENGKVEELFTTSTVETATPSQMLPLGLEVEEEKQSDADEAFVHLAERLMEELRKFFKPELLNRFDEAIVFHPLSRENMSKIVDLQVGILAKLLIEQNIAISVSVAAKDYLAEAGFDPIFGARPLRRTIQRMVENPISSLLIKGELSTGDTLTVDFDGDNLIFQVKRFEARKAQQTKAQTQEQEASKVSVPLIRYTCQTCGNQWEAQKTDDSPVVCPKCTGTTVVETPVATAQTEKPQAETAAPVSESNQPQVQPNQPQQEVSQQPPVNPLETYFTPSGDQPVVGTTPQSGDQSGLPSQANSAEEKPQETSSVSV